jgi:DegV family protein with EDD domain
MTVKIITDSTSYLEKDYIEKENITVVPLHYIFDEQEYREGFPGEFGEFYRKLENTKFFPTTSQPAAGDFFDAYNEAFKEHDEVIAIVLSSKISGTYASAVLADGMLEDKKVTIVDSHASAAALRYLVEDAVEMSKEGLNAAAIASELNERKKKLDILVTPETLEYLSRGGRMSSLQSSIGNLLNIKPIIRLVDGELKLAEKARGRNKALAKIIKMVKDDVKRISVCHIMNLEEAKVMAEDLKNQYPDAVVTIDELGPVIGSHLGPKTLALCLYY